MRILLSAFFRQHKKMVGALLFLIGFSVTVVYATPPASPYTSGETLDPTCAPGDTNCSVTILPDQTGNNGKYLTTDGTTTSWVSISGAGLGDVVGPSIGTDNMLPRFDGSTGKLIQGSGVILTDQNPSIGKNLTLDISGITSSEKTKVSKQLRIREKL